MRTNIIHNLKYILDQDRKTEKQKMFEFCLGLVGGGGGLKFEVYHPKISVFASFSVAGIYCKLRN